MSLHETCIQDHATCLKKLSLRGIYFVQELLSGKSFELHKTTSARKIGREAVPELCMAMDNLTAGDSKVPLLTHPSK